MEARHYLLLIGIAVFPFCLIFHYSMLFRRIKLAQANAIKRTVGENLFESGTIASRDDHLAEFSKTSVAACFWRIWVYVGRKGNSWEEAQSGYTGFPINFKSQIGYNYKIELTPDSIDTEGESEFQQNFYSTEGDFVNMKVSEVFSSKKEHTTAKKDEVQIFAESKGVSIKGHFGMNRAVRVEEILFRSGEAYNILGILGPGNTIVGTSKRKIEFFKKDADQILESLRRSIFWCSVVAIAYLVFLAWSFGVRGF